MEAAEARYDQNEEVLTATRLAPHELVVHAQALKPRHELSRFESLPPEVLTLIWRFVAPSMVEQLTEGARIDYSLTSKALLPFTRARLVQHLRLATSERCLLGLLDFLRKYDHLLMEICSLEAVADAETKAEDWEHLSLLFDMADAMHHLNHLVLAGQGSSMVCWPSRRTNTLVLQQVRTLTLHRVNLVYWNATLPLAGLHCLQLEDVDGLDGPQAALLFGQCRALDRLVLKQVWGDDDGDGYDVAVLRSLLIIAGDLTELVFASFLETFDEDDGRVFQLPLHYLPDDVVNLLPLTLRVLHLDQIDFLLSTALVERVAKLISLRSLKLWEGFYYDQGWSWTLRDLEASKKRF